MWLYRITSVAVFGVLVYWGLTKLHPEPDATAEELARFLSATDYEECAKENLKMTLHKKGRIRGSDLTKSDELCTKYPLLYDSGRDQAQIKTDLLEVSVEEIPVSEYRAQAAAAAKNEADRVARLKRQQAETRYQQELRGEAGNEVLASYDDLIRQYVSRQWRRPPTARNGMIVEIRMSMLPSGEVTDAVVVRSSGDAGFDQSAVQAVREVRRIPEMQHLSQQKPAVFDRIFRQRHLRLKPEDLDS